MCIINAGAIGETGSTGATGATGHGQINPPPTTDIPCLSGPVG